MKPTCDILMAAYNGQKYGPELLDSLLAQTYQDYRLLVRDDGSSDRTMEMLRAYEPKFGGRMQFLETTAPTGSALGNFSILMAASDADYVICADIDDVWFPEKVADTVASLRQAEAERSADTPVYVFSDVVPVDADLKQVAKSYWAFKQIDPAVGSRLSQSLVCAVMLGCASGMNRALVRRCLPIPNNVTGHDWWALLVAIVFGEVRYIPKTTMLYRLHGNNQSAPKKVGFLNYLQSKHGVGFVRHGMERRREQARALMERFGDSLDPQSRAVIAGFVATGGQGFIQRRVSLLRGNYLYSDLPRNLALMVGA